MEKFCKVCRKAIKNGDYVLWEEKRECLYINMKTLDDHEGHVTIRHYIHNECATDN